MISHKYKCIFIHIPRCAGSSIEQWICGADWWEIEPETKHLLASQSRALYADYWDSYFKFSIVRDPVDRMISCLKYPEYFGLAVNENRISLDAYYERFGREVVIEHDYRFYQREALVSPKHGAGKVYGNVLDEELDFIARYENLEADVKFIGDKIGLPYSAPLDRLQQSAERIPLYLLHSTSRSEIEHLFRDDFTKFGYSK